MTIERRVYIMVALVGLIGLAVVCLSGCTPQINREFAHAAQGRNEIAATVHRLSIVVADMAHGAGDIRSEVVAEQCAADAKRAAETAAEDIERNESASSVDVVGMITDVSTGNYAGLATGLIGIAGVVLGYRRKIKRVVGKAREYAALDANEGTKRAENDKDFNV